MKYVLSLLMFLGFTTNLQAAAAAAAPAAAEDLAGAAVAVQPSIYLDIETDKYAFPADANLGLLNSIINPYFEAKQRTLEAQFEKHKGAMESARAKGLATPTLQPRTAINLRQLGTIHPQVLINSEQVLRIETREGSPTIRTPLEKGFESNVNELFVVPASGLLLQAYPDLPPRALRPIIPCRPGLVLSGTTGRPVNAAVAAAEFAARAAVAAAAVVADAGAGGGAAAAAVAGSGGAAAGSGAAAPKG